MLKLSLLLLLAWAGAGVAAAQAGETYTPKQGTPERKAILDAVRQKLDINSQFSVDHMKVNGDWAYFRGTEVFFDGGERQETDLGVAVLLERRGTGGRETWMIAEMWTLPTESESPFKQFVARVRRRQKAGKIPADIFPPEM
ncbi:MAG: hypothetical protein ACRD9R_16645 [Pyrinomonadaceae bacterium]